MDNVTTIKAHKSEIKCMIVLNDSNFSTGARVT